MAAAGALSTCDCEGRRPCDFAARFIRVAPSGGAQRAQYPGHTGQIRDKEKGRPVARPPLLVPAMVRGSEPGSDPEERLPAQPVIGLVVIGCTARDDLRR